MATGHDPSPDAEWRPCARDQIASVVVDGETVVYDERSGAIHRLDQIATVVWQRLDGTVTTAALVAGLAADFGAGPDVVERDVQQLLGHLTEQGLLVVQGRASSSAGA